MSETQNFSLKKKGSSREIISNSWWAICTLFRLAPLEFSVYGVTSVLQACFPAIQAYLVARAIDQIIQLVESGPDTYSNLTFTDSIFITFAFAVINSLLTRITDTTKSYMGSRVDKLYLEKYYQTIEIRISMLDVQQYEDPVTSDLIQKAKDNEYKLDYFFTSFSELLTKTASVIIAFWVTVRLSPLITAIIIILALPSTFIYAKFLKRIWLYYNHNMEPRRKARQIERDLTFDLYMPEHKVTNSHIHLASIARGIYTKWLHGRINIYHDLFKETLLTSFSKLIESIITLTFILREVLLKHISVGSVTFYLSQFGELSWGIDYITGQYITMGDNAQYLGFVRKIMEIEPIIKSGSHIINTDKPPMIQFDHVWFKYPRSTRYALRDITFTINPSEEIAIVGENGAGKTTIIKLLLRYYDPTKGTIYIDGTPLQDIHLPTYYNAIGALFQDFITFTSLTVKQNITIGDFTRKASKRNIVDAAKDADAATFIDALDHKYQQVIGKEFTGGINLSTGQRQKLALARMFYRDRPILILDEPTASIDAAAESKIFQRIYRFIQDKTVIIISHRFSTVRNASKIYVLKGGSIIETGTHESLMKKNGMYAKAFLLQARGYKRGSVPA